MLKRPGRSSRGLDGNAPRLLLRALRDGDFQHPVHVPGLDRLGIGALGKGEAAQECPRRALEALEAVRGSLALRAALAADRQHALVGRDLDVLALDARRVSGPVFAGPENWASRGRWSGAETGLANVEAQAQGDRFCGQAVQNLCFIWVQDIVVGPRLAPGAVLEKIRCVPRPRIS